MGKCNFYSRRYFTVISSIFRLFASIWFVSRLLIDANVHLHEFLPRHLAPSSESTFVVEENRLQLSASIKRFCSPQDVLLAVQNVLEVLAAAVKLSDGAVAGFAYRTQIQKLLDRRHSLDTVVGVHEEFLRHLCKHDSFDIAGDTVLGKYLSPSSFHAQRNSWGSGMYGSWGGGQQTGRAPPKDSCYTCGGENFAANCPDFKGLLIGHCTGCGGCGASFPAPPTPREEHTNSAHT